MSRIFEALQRSEEERSGVEFLAPVESVADLLRVEERGTTRESSAADILSAAPVLYPSPAAEGRLVCLTEQGSMGAEKFRVLGLRLRHMREKRKLRRIVVTSSIPQEGKSVIAANLALNQSRSKVLKTVLLDGDLRRPTQATRLGFNGNLPGLSDCLRGERNPSEIVYKLDGSGLWFVPAGLPPGNPIDLMQSGRLPDILEQFETFFDWIIIDTPPIFPLADTPLWMKLADGVLLVAREGVSEKKMLGKAVEVVDRSTLLGVIVNSCNGTGQKYYYSRYSPDAVHASQASSPSAGS